MLKAGDIAPDHSLEADVGTASVPSRHGDWPGASSAHPKGDAPDCALECKELRDAREASLGKALFGMSPDERARHVCFRDEYGLDFPLLCDVGHEVAETYGASGQTKRGVLRTAFIIGTDGRVRRAFENVNPQGHAAEVFAAS